MAGQSVQKDSVQAGLADGHMSIPCKDNFGPVWKECNSYFTILYINYPGKWVKSFQQYFFLAPLLQSKVLRKKPRAPGGRCPRSPAARRFLHHNTANAGGF